MVNVALVALLTALQASTPAQPELKGQACTARELVGTWQFSSKPSMPMPGITTVLKHITPTHFFVVRIGAKDVVTSAQGDRTHWRMELTQRPCNTGSVNYSKWPGARPWRSNADSTVTCCISSVKSRGPRSTSNGGEPPARQANVETHQQ